MEKLWDKIDHHRKDKYLLFVRIQLNEIFNYFKRLKHKELRNNLKTILNIIYNNESRAVGMMLHVTEIYFEELFKTNKHISANDLSIFVEALIESTSSVNRKDVRERVKKEAFERLINENKQNHCEEKCENSNNLHFCHYNPEETSSIIFKHATDKNISDENRSMLYSIFKIASGEDGASPPRLSVQEKLEKAYQQMRSKLKAIKTKKLRRLQRMTSPISPSQIPLSLQAIIEKESIEKGQEKTDANKEEEKVEGKSKQKSQGSAPEKENLKKELFKKEKKTKKKQDSKENKKHSVNEKQEVKKEKENETKKQEEVKAGPIVTLGKRKRSDNPFEERVSKQIKELENRIMNEEKWKNTYQLEKIVEEEDIIDQELVISPKKKKKRGANKSTEPAVAVISTGVPARSNSKLSSVTPVKDFLNNKGFVTPQKKVKFALHSNQTKEFFINGKVSSEKLQRSIERPDPVSGIIKKREPLNMTTIF